MRPLIPSQTALVLGGGGAKGAYEIGAIEALAELGIQAGSVYGTSIGALNAAMLAQGDLDAAVSLWETLRLIETRVDCADWHTWSLSAWLSSCE